MAGRSLPRRDGHSSGTGIAARLEQPTRTTGPGNRSPTLAGGHRPYSVLLPVGLAMPSPLPGPRCALTAPFHPYRVPKRAAVRSLWRYPWGRPRRRLSGTVFPWSPDFPPPKRGACGSGRPADWRAPSAPSRRRRQGRRAAAFAGRRRVSCWPPCRRSPRCCAPLRNRRGWRRSSGSPDARSDIS